jgi:HPt (histidine-containing phosphotransfer) domain-containing protein
VGFHCDAACALLLGANKLSKLEAELQQELAVAQGELATVQLEMQGAGVEIARLQQALKGREKEVDFLSQDKHRLVVKLKSIVPKQQSTINSFFTNSQGTKSKIRVANDLDSPRAVIFCLGIKLDEKGHPIDEQYLRREKYDKPISTLQAQHSSTYSRLLHTADLATMTVLGGMHVDVKEQEQLLQHVAEKHKAHGVRKETSVAAIMATSMVKQLVKSYNNALGNY